MSFSFVHRLGAHRDGLYTEAEVKNVECPYAAQHDTACDNALGTHHDEANAHEYGDSDHDADLGFPGHAAPCHIVFQIVLIQLGALEPAIQLFGASCKAEGRQHQERKSRQHGHHSAHSTQTDTDTAENDVENLLDTPLFFSIRLCSFFVSMTCRMAMTG